MEIKSLSDIDELFPDEESAKKYLINLRWENGIYSKCPYCGNDRAYYINNGKRFECAAKQCKRRFSVTSRTVFEATKLKLVQWLKVVYIYVSSRGTPSHFEIIEGAKITAKTEYFIREKLDFIWSKVKKEDKTKHEKFEEVFKLGFNLYDKFNEKKDSLYHKNPFHIKDEDIYNIADKNQYNKLLRYTSYYYKVYCRWIFIDFTTPNEILSNAFIYMADNGIKEYNGSSIIKIIQYVLGNSWYNYLKNHPKYNVDVSKKSKYWKKEARENLSDYYIVQLLKSSKDYSSKTTKELKKDKQLISKKREEITIKRKMNGGVHDFVSHFG